MKKLINIIFIAIAIVNGQWSMVNGQSPNAIPYQAVARDAGGNLIANQNISVRFSIHDGTATGAVQYKETQTAVTNALGLFTLNIGQGTVVSGTFAGITWGSGAKFTQVEIDPTGGSSFVDMGTNQMMSVPYALFAGNGGGGTTYTSGTGIDLTGNVIINTAPDQTVSLTGTGATYVTGSYPNFTVNSTDNNTTYIGGTGIDISGTTVNSKWTTTGNDLSNNNSGNVGIGTSTPGFLLDVGGRMRIKSGGGSAGTWFSNSTNTVDAAFIGILDDNNVGIFGSGTGWGLNLRTNSGGISMGNSTTNIPSGQYSTTIGSGNTASGLSSTVIGYNSVASSQGCVTIGTGSSSTNDYAIAIGVDLTASGLRSIAMGSYASTNLRNGALAIGDNTIPSTILNAISDNSFSSRFSGGYRLFSNGNMTTGVSLSAGGGSWTSISDWNKKENFFAINNEDILVKVGNLPMSQWNYKSQEANVHHIGCMAQDFYAAFHLDGESDTTINTLDIDGINMAAIQALKTRTDELKEAMHQLQLKSEETSELKADISEMKKQIDVLVKNNNTIVSSAKQ